MKCLATNDIEVFLELESTTTVSKALDGATLSKIEKAIGKKSVIKSLCFFISRFNDNFNAKGKLNEMQIATLGMDLFEVFKYESLEDAMLMFKYARQGKIGDGKDFKLDSQTVFHKWMPAYLELKSIAREEKRKKEKQKEQEFSSSDFNNKVHKEMFKDVGEQELIHNKKGGGLGGRAKKILKKEGVITERSDYLIHMRRLAAEAKSSQLKNYLINNNFDSENYDQQVYEIVEIELDVRSGKRTRIKPEDLIKKTNNR